jgi:hypothetical protein
MWHLIFITIPNGVLDKYGPRAIQSDGSTRSQTDGILDLNRLYVSSRIHEVDLKCLDARRSVLVTRLIIPVKAVSTQSLPYVMAFNIPIKRLMQHLQPRLLQLPPKNQPHVLHQMASQLDMSHIRRMVLRPDIIPLQNPCSIEVVNITTLTLSLRVQRAIIEILNNTFDLWAKSAALNVSCTGGREAAPEA